jgi:hypothetical protein
MFVLLDTLMQSRMKSYSPTPFMGEGIRNFASRYDR